MSIIAASYNSDLAGDFGREVRNVMASQEHNVLFPGAGLAADSKAQNRWHTDQGGGYAAAGVGTAVTGRGAHVFLIDDPVKDRESADSELQREKTYRWYLSTAYTRLEGTLTGQDEDPLWRDVEEAQEEGEAFEGAIVLIETRWHDDDLAGRLIEDMERGADQWDVLSLPAVSTKGEALWPGKFSKERLDRIKTQLSGREWESLYQQQPTPREGTYFQRSWFERHDDVPKDWNVFITGDFAVTPEGGDFTELGVWAVGPEREIAQIDWWGGQENSAVWVEALIDLMEKHKPRAFFGESGQIRRAVEPFLRARMKERKAFCRMDWITRVADKEVSATGFQGRAEMGMVSIANTEDGKALIEQLVAFPTGKYDDKVDACAILGMAIGMARPAFTSTEKSKPKRDRYADKEEAVNWKTM